MIDADAVSEAVGPAPPASAPPALQAPPEQAPLAPSGSSASDATSERAPAEALLEPRDGVPGVVADHDALLAAAARIAAGTGPVALDAERASGYRYGNRAYLLQLRRRGSGTVLIDPVGLGDLAPIAAALQDAEWVLHAASQDLGCLAEIGLRPTRLFDTELAGRLLGYPRVALGTLVEEILGFRLEKGHAAVDWSRRPLPEAWLQYAALDVELLVELRDALDDQLREAGKEQWAYEEFAALCELAPPPPREDPWRRTSGLHRIRKPRQLAVVRELWETREHIAERRNLAPGRVLPDHAIVAAALALPATPDELVAVPGFGGRATKRGVDTWFRAVDAGRAARRLPPVTRSSDGPPPPRAWAARNPDAAARLTACRLAVSTRATELLLPTENLIAPDIVRRLAWEPPAEVTSETVSDVLRSAGARPWQVELTAALLVAALHDAPHADVTAATAAGRDRHVAAGESKIADTSAPK